MRLRSNQLHSRQLSPHRVANAIPSSAGPLANQLYSRLSRALPNYWQTIIANSAELISTLTETRRSSAVERKERLSMTKQRLVHAMASRSALGVSDASTADIADVRGREGILRNDSSPASPSTSARRPERLSKAHETFSAIYTNPHLMRYSVDFTYSPETSSRSAFSTPISRRSSSFGRDSALIQGKTPYRIVDIYQSSRGIWYMRIAPEFMLSSSSQTVFRSASMSIQRIARKLIELHRDSTSYDAIPASRASSVPSATHGTCLPSTQRWRASDGTSKRNQKILSADSPYLSIPFYRANAWDIVLDVLDVSYPGWNDASGNNTAVLKRIKKELRVVDVSYRQYLPKIAHQAPPKMVTHFNITHRAKDGHARTVTMPPMSSDSGCGNEAEVPTGGHDALSKGSMKWWKQLSRVLLH